MLLQNKITKIQAREILDSRGNPTIETTVWAGERKASASAPSGASTGSHEAVELRDGNLRRYGGLGVLKVCRIVNTKITSALVGIDATGQKKIDDILCQLDGTSNKSKLGANTTLSASLAVARLAARLEHAELYRYLAQTYHYRVKSMPTPLFNVINGGRHANNGLDIQEFFLIPQKGVFAERLRRAAEVYCVLKNQLSAKGQSTAVGDEGGFAPKLRSNEAGLQLLVRAIDKAYYTLGVDFKLGIDAAATEFYSPKTKWYWLRGVPVGYKAAALYKMYSTWAEKYYLALIEDGFAEDDWESWKLLTKGLGKRAVLVGDDVFATNAARIKMGISESVANAVLIKPNQIGTLSETMTAIKLAQKHKYKVVISHRSGETCDSFIADLAVGVNAEYIKAGAPARGERLAKYNRLLEIESQIV